MIQIKRPHWKQSIFKSGGDQYDLNMFTETNAQRRKVESNWSNFILVSAGFTNIQMCTER